MKTVKNLYSCAIAAMLLFAGMGCETNLQQSAEDLSLMARNATEVLPPDVVFVSMMNVQEIQDNQLINPFGPEGLLNEATNSEAMARLRDFIDRTGFDPEKDLSEAYLALSSGQGKEEKVSIAIYVNMDRELLEDYIETELENQFLPTNYKGTDIYLAKEDEKSFGFSLVNDNMILAASEPALVEAMIDRLNKEAPALDTNANMMRLVNLASAGQSGWVVVQKPDHIEAPEGDSELENTMSQLWFAVSSMAVLGNVESEAIEGQIMLIPSDEINASDLTSLVKGALAAAKALDGSDDFLALLDQVRVTDQQDHVRIQVDAPNDLIRSVRGN